MTSFVREARLTSTTSGVVKAGPPKASYVKLFVLYIFYIDDIIASCDIVDVTLVLSLIHI